MNLILRRNLALLAGILCAQWMLSPIFADNRNAGDSGPASEAAQGVPKFTDVTAAAGLPTDYFYAFGGPIWGDYDNDGLLDLYTDNHDHAAPFLYHNNGDGTFTNIIKSSGIILGGDKHGSAWVDFDNDGDLDLFQTKGAGAGHNVGMHKNEFYENLGGGTFTNISTAAGTDDPDGRGRSVAWADINNDGYPDLLLGNLRTPVVLYLNNGDNTFTEITGPAGLGNLHYVEVAFADYDNDGYPDIFVTNTQMNAQQPDILFHNNGDNTFTNVSAQAGIAPLVQGRSIAWGDYDDDGYLDLFISRGTDDGALKQTLYHNNGDGTFTDVSDAAGVGVIANNRQACWGDFDNDGYLDLYVVNSGDDTNGKGPNYLYHNNRDGTFTDVAARTGVQVLVPSRGRGAGWGDYDNDGFLDLFVTNGEDNTSFDMGPKILYHNRGNQNSWLEVVLVGTTSNRRGLGARVTVQAGRLTQYQEMNGALGHYLSQDAAPLHFGLAKARRATVTVRWPSGIIDTMSGVAANSILTITEGSTNP